MQPSHGRGVVARPLTPLVAGHSRHLAGPYAARQHVPRPAPALLTTRSKLVPCNPQAAAGNSDQSVVGRSDAPRGGKQALLQRLHELGQQERGLIACLANAAQAWTAGTGNDAGKQQFEAVEEDLERLAKERADVLARLLGSAPALPTADAVVNSSLAPLQCTERAKPGRTTVCPAYPDFVEEWCDVEAPILAQPVPPGHLPAHRTSSTPVQSSDKALTTEVSTTIINTINELLQLAGSPAQWVQSPCEGQLPGHPQLNSMRAREPQFELILQGQRMAFLFVELPEVFRHMLGASLLCEWWEAQVTGKTKNGVHSITHATNYASTWGCRYGAITTYNTTWLLKFSQRGVYISRPFAWNGRKPSVLQALWFVTQQALGLESRMETWQPLQELPRPAHLLVPGNAGRGDGSAPAAPADWPATSDQTQAGSGTEQGEPGATWLLQGATEERVAGYGITGWAIAARLRDGREVVVKHSQEPELQQQLMHEAHILETKLQHLMGQEVAELVGHGWGPRGKAYWLATRLVQGDNLRAHLQEHPDDAQVLHAAAAAALRRIHAAGVTHGDVRYENIIIVPAGGAGSQGPAVVFIDFGRAEDCTDARRHAGEQLVLSELFEPGAWESWQPY